MTGFRFRCGLSALAGAAFVLFGGAPLIAQDSSASDPHAAQPERPTVATHAFTVAPRYVEVEAGGQVAAPKDASELQMPVLMKVGVFPNLQFDFAPAYTRERDHDDVVQGVNDLVFALKWHAASDVPLLGDFAVQTSLSVPSAPARTVGTGTTGVSVLGISSRKWGDYELDVNAGVTRRNGDGSRAPKIATLWTVSLAVPIAGHLASAIEVFGYPGTSAVAGEPPQVGFLIGPTYAIRPWIVLDAGAILNVSHQGANSVYAGLTWNIGRF